MKAFLNSVRFALQGIRFAWSGRNFRIQFIIGVVVCLCAATLGVTESEWLVILLFTGFVLASEIINSALENLVDFVSPEFHPLAGKIKDMAAGAVLISSFFAAVAGLIIFLPYIFAIFES